MNAEGLKRCPFCRAAAVHAFTKATRDQLHGERLQRYRVWCPRGCASIDGPNKMTAFSRWNRRALPTREELARAICLADGRHCRDNHVCDPCPANCAAHHLHGEAADAILALLNAPSGGSDHG